MYTMFQDKLGRVLCLGLAQTVLITYSFLFCTENKNATMHDIHTHAGCSS